MRDAIQIVNKFLLTGTVYLIDLIHTPITRQSSPKRPTSWSRLSILLRQRPDGTERWYCRINVTWFAYKRCINNQDVAIVR